MNLGMGWAGWAVGGAGLWAVGCGLGLGLELCHASRKAFFGVQLAPSLSPRAGQSNDSGGPASI